MSHSLTRTLLRRIALGLPLVEGPLELGRRVVRPLAGGALVIGVGVTGCTTCDVVQTASSTHPRSSFIESVVGTPESFDASQCDSLCRQLDGLGSDAGMSPDAGTFMGYESPGATAQCFYQDDDVLGCRYQVLVCSTQGPCATSIAGRAPAGLRAARLRVSSPVGRWLAHNAHLEAASVPAFEELALELERFGAPSVFGRAARQSAADERRHARDVARLALRLGAAVPAVERADHGERSLLEMARDNATEGCVREAYGALLAAMQAERAESAAVRSVYQRIAADEARHALLSLAIDEWAQAQIGGRGRREILDARREAIEGLTTSLGDEPELSMGRVLGLPDATRGVGVVQLLAA